MTASTGKRRARGTGTVRLKREPDGWEVRAPARNEAGKAIQISRMVYGSRRDAERALREMQGEVDRGPGTPRRAGAGWRVRHPP